MAVPVLLAVFAVVTALGPALVHACSVDQLSKSVDELFDRDLPARVGDLRAECDMLNCWHDSEYNVLASSAYTDKLKELVAFFREQRDQIKSNSGACWIDGDVSAPSVQDHYLLRLEEKIQPMLELIEKVLPFNKCLDCFGGTTLYEVSEQMHDARINGQLTKVGLFAPDCVTPTYNSTTSKFESRCTGEAPAPLSSQGGVSSLGISPSLVSTPSSMPTQPAPLPAPPPSSAGAPPGPAKKSPSARGGKGTGVSAKASSAAAPALAKTQKKIQAVQSRISEVKEKTKSEGLRKKAKRKLRNLMQKLKNLLRKLFRRKKRQEKA